MKTDRPRRYPTALMLAALSLAGCAEGQESAPESRQQAAAVQRAEPRPAPSPATATASVPSTTPVLTSDGYGPLRIGMSLAEVTAAYGPKANADSVGGPDPAQCDQFHPARAPEGMLVMLENGRLTRITLIRESRIKTDRGIGLGDTSAAVLAAYGTAARVSPHKYVDAPASYITVWTRNAPAAESAVPPSARGLVFEIDARERVNFIHGGGPSIQYVEGCL